MSGEKNPVEERVLDPRREDWARLDQVALLDADYDGKKCSGNRFKRDSFAK